MDSIRNFLLSNLCPVYCKETIRLVCVAGNSLRSQRSQHFLILLEAFCPFYWNQKLQHWETLLYRWVCVFVVQHCQYSSWVKNLIACSLVYLSKTPVTSFVIVTFSYWVIGLLFYHLSKKSFFSPFFILGSFFLVLYAGNWSKITNYTLLGRAAG